MIRKAFAISLLAITLVTGLSASETKTGGNEFLPYLAGTRFYYMSSFGEIKTEISKHGNMLFIRNSGDKLTYDQDLFMTGSGLRLNRVYQKFKVMLFITKEATTTYKDPLLRFPPRFTIGTTWSSNTVEYAQGDSATICLTGRVVGEETITVAAGKFTTLKIETVFSHPHGSESKVTDWIAPGIGIVKTAIHMSGDGLTGIIRNVLGYSDIVFELKKWEKI
jgi:hypothetical protein